MTIIKNKPKTKTEMNNTKTENTDYYWTTEQERSEQRQREETEKQRQLEEEYCRPIEQILSSEEFNKKIQIMLGERAITKSCFVVYDDGTTSELVPLVGDEPYDLFQDRQPDTPFGLDKFKELFICEDTNGVEPKPKTDVSMIVYTPNLDSQDSTIATKDCHLNPSLSDIELLKRANTHYPGVTEVMVAEEDQYTDLLLCRQFDSESPNLKLAFLKGLGKTASKAAVRSVYAAGGVSVAEVRENGDKTANIKQVKAAAHKLIQKAA